MSSNHTSPHFPSHTLKTEPEGGVIPQRASSPFRFSAAMFLKKLLEAGGMPEARRSYLYRELSSYRYLPLEES